MRNPLGSHEQSNRRKGWSTGKQLQTGNSGQNVTLQCQLDEPTPVHIQIDVVPPADTSAVAIAKATVHFSCDGTPLIRSFDVAAGASISGVADAVRVIVTDQTVLGLGAKSLPYNVTISIASRPRPTVAVPPVLTGKQATAVPPTGIITAQIPQGASGVVIYAVDSVTGGQPSLVLAEQLADAGGIILSTAVVIGQGVPLLSGARFVSVQNVGANSSLVTIVFPVDG